MGRETTATDSSDPPEPPSTVVAPGERNASPTVHDSEPSDEKQREPSSSEPPDVVYPKGIKLAFLLLSVYVTTFLVALVGRGDRATHHFFLTY